MKRYNMHSDNPQDQATSSASPMASLSSLFLSNPRSLRLPNPNPNPNPQIHLPLRSQTLTFSSNSSQISTDSPPPPPPPPEKKSFAVATGELFLGIATRIIKRRNGIDGGDSNSVPITMFRDSERESYFWRRTKEGIASVVEDPVQPEVVWEQRLKDVEAERCRKAVTSPGFSFSAAGLLFPYHLGVAQFLIEKGYIKDTTPLAGSSAGAIVCAVIASGASMEEALKATKILAEDCRLRGTAFRLGAVLKDVLDKFLPDDVHFRSNGRVRVAVTQILWRPRGLLVDQFDSKEDLINAVFTSSFIPGYVAPRPATMFRNRLCIDGGLTLFMPPTSATQTIRVCAFPASRLGLQGIGISPDCNPESRATPREDAMTQDINWPLCGNFFELPFCSRGTEHAFSKPRQKLSTAKEFSQFKSNASKLKNSFSDDEIFCNMEEKNDDIWNDSPPPYSKQRRSENDRDFITPDETWYPMGGRKCDIRDVTNHQAWSCFVTENAEESLSLLSEESCSSSAVRGKATNRSPSDSVARQNIRRYGRDIRSLANKCSVENIYAKDRHYEKSDNFHEWKKIDEPGKFTKMCNPSSSNPAHYSNTTSQKKLRPEDSCLFEEEYISADRDSGFGSVCQTSGAKKRASSGPMCWTEDPFGAYPLPELHANAKSSFARSIHNVLPELSPSGSFSSEKLGFCQPYSNVHSYETPVFSTIGSGRSKPNLHMDSNVEVRPQDSFPVSGSHRDAEFLCVSVEESVSKNGGNRSEILPTDCIQFELQKDVGIGSNELSSENGQSLEASGSKDNCSDCNEAKGLTPKLEGRKAMVSPEHAEEISSSVKIRCKFEGSIDEKECHNDTQTSLPRQNGSIETEDSGRKERKLESKGQDNTSVNPSCQVMMLESYVLQLLCVQKVLNEASVQGTVKKV